MGVSILKTQLPSFTRTLGILRKTSKGDSLWVSTKNRQKTYHRGGLDGGFGLGMPEIPLIHPSV